MRVWRAGVITLMWTYCAQAQVEPPSVPSTSVHGFATIGAVYQGEHGIAFRRSINQPSGATGDEIDAGVDSRIGVQLNQRLGRYAELVLQAASENDARGWQPQLTRAFVRLRPIDGVSLRVGRLPYEFHSGPVSRYAGYSSLMLRQPSELFGTLPSNQFDGLDLSYTFETDSTITRLRGYAGETYGTMVTHDGLRRDISGSPMYGLSVETVSGDWTFRVSGLRVELPSAGTLPVPGTPAGPAPDDGGDVDWTSNALLRQRVLETFSLGVLYESGPLQSQLCFTHLDGSRSQVPSQDVGVLLFGYRVGALTPYASYSFVDNQSHGVYAAASPEVGTYRGTEQQTIALGIRYDVRPRYALKFQLDRVHLGDHHLMLDTDPLTRDPEQMLVYSVALDLLF